MRKYGLVFGAVGALALVGLAGYAAALLQSSPDTPMSSVVAQAEEGKEQPPSGEVEERAVPPRMTPRPGIAPAPALTPQPMVPAAPLAFKPLPGEFALQTVLKGNYLTAVGGGGRITDVVHTDATQPRAWEKFKLWTTGPGVLPQYAFQTASGNFVTAVGGGGQTTDVIHTDATQIQSWETFSIPRNGTVYGSHAIRTVHGQYLTALGGGGHADPPAVHTNATNVGSWESFWPLKCGDLGPGDRYRISFRPGTFFLAYRGGGQVQNAIVNTSTPTTQIGLWSDEQTLFSLWRQNDGTYAIQTADGHWVTAVGGGGQTNDVLHTDATQVQSWEKFGFIDQGNCAYAIKTVSGFFLGVGGDGSISSRISDPNAAPSIGYNAKFQLMVFTND